MAIPSQIVSYLDVMIKARRPAMLWGKPGVGKSSLVRQAAERHNMGFLDIRLSQLDPVDLRGLPFVKDGIAHFAPPAMLPHGEKTKVLVFLDELAQAPMLVQNSASELLLDRKLGEYTLPEGCIVMAASNRKSDKAGTVDVPTHLRNRLGHIEVEEHVGEWIDWAIKAKLSEQVTGFIRFRQNLLCKMPEKSDENAFPTPRTWEFVSQALPHVSDAVTRLNVVSGFVGPGCASEFIGYCDIYQTLPDVDAILKNPAKAPKPPTGKPSVMYALCSVLARRVNETNHANFFTYIEGIPVEFQVCCLHDARSAWPLIRNTPGFSKWATKNQDILTGS